MATQNENRLCLGVITGAHGIRGQVRVKSFTADPEHLTAYGALSDAKGEHVFKLTVNGQSKGQLIVKIKGVNDRNAAEGLKGQELFIDRDRLPAPDEDEFYHADLIGLSVETIDGEAYGKVKAVHDFGAGDILDIALVGGKAVMLPFTKETVPAIDLTAGKLVVNPPVETVAKADEEDASEEKQA